ncbi:large ribosomal subunit protein eL28-like [Erinaceus europaeus]|uniref:Large ribosomal subunit protein eL28-like n=1 Tax=Erinaceus europaeus TaxID=9365 RepID=A0ABM3VRL1_ERIEU|nr:large ribosomal subunit protein eL28-like [Erinaceus europaeus]XP_060026968.1 large ribosomal subunit protein eL28-like [Erinaceus europaeus]XP_060026969.1 large ribosomal subunit protein eL28-like [Erinaceus europaeus]XP_060026970.1 large ribosomal subunit protein eL28-like [Erinaceus europaeus]XP_060026971.1 large ribosomal subunit protein eL28-like [Erinaceus europaeus]XP_060026973.1 large ribosomal subunit protein eL28-like [Erinaceus europaeus]
MSAHLQWMVARNRCRSLIRRNQQTYSTEPNNLKARNSFRYDGLIHHKTGQRKPATSYVRTTINKNIRATLSSILHMIRKNIRRASAILRSQTPVMGKRRRAHPTESS